MESEQILHHRHQLNTELERRGLKGEICLYGGAVMCLVYNARPSTKDIDAVFAPAQEMRDAIVRVAEENSLDADWINDAVKGYVIKHEQRVLLNLSNLQVYVPEPDYLLAMKALAARVDASDRQDVQVLIRALKITQADEVFRILRSYYPRHEIKPATQYFIEELFQQ
ncbi:MAG TPA: DUF6036 family nucleotidyltransferase [Terriglobales bacterium]|nr:DUF6036 family nucleotidyltransferase [Terriglobales bacterium]